MSPHPKWERPAFYGRPAAIDAMGTIAAPFLAGIGIALAVLVISNEADFGAASEALLALVAATTLLVACVECAFVARQYVVTPGELEEWRPDPTEDKRIELLEQEQKNALEKFERWSNLARWAYNFGILAFGAGVVFLLVPANGLATAPDLRRWTFGLACVAVGAEAGSVVWSFGRGVWLKRKAKPSNSSAGASGAASGTPGSEAQWPRDRPAS